MEITLLLEFSERQQLRDWLQDNHASAKECWVVMSRSKNPIGVLPYLDVVEEALCFGWIDIPTEDLLRDCHQEERRATGPNSISRDVRIWKAEA